MLCAKEGDADNMVGHVTIVYMYVDHMIIT